MQIRQKQQWGEMTRYLLGNQHCSVALQLTPQPIDEYGIQAYISHLWVDEEWRRHGLATTMLKQCEQLAKEYGCKETHLDWSLTESPRWVLDWYFRQGYDEQSFGKDNALLRKELIP